jgi:hypothetical protein
LIGFILALLLFYVLRRVSVDLRRKRFSNIQLVELFVIVSIGVLSGILGSTNGYRVESRWFFLMLASFVILLSPRFNFVSPKRLFAVAILLVIVLFATYADSQKIHDYSQRVRWAEVVSDLNKATEASSSWQLAVTDSWQPTYLGWITRHGDIWKTFLRNPPLVVEQNKKSCRDLNVRCIYADLRKSGYVIYETTGEQATILKTKQR